MTALLLAFGLAGAGAAAAAAADSLPPAGPSAEAGAPAPERVVSVNGCTDQLALLLAAPGQLVSVSHVAHDPLSSVLWREAAGYPTNHAGAEEIYLLAPDLVLAGAYDDPATLAMLERLGLEVARFPLESSFEDIRTNLRRMGDLLGQQTRAEALVAELDAALAAAASDTAARDAAGRPRAVVQSTNSFTSGANSLADAVLEAAGLTNIAAEAGITGMGRLPLELLVLARPDLIVSRQGYQAPALAQEVLHHRAARVLEGTRRAELPDALWTCGTPRIAEAVEQLAAAAGR